MAEGLTAAGLARPHGASEQHVSDEDLPGLLALVARANRYTWGRWADWRRVATQRMFDGPATPQAHRDIRVAAYAALG